MSSLRRHLPIIGPKPQTPEWFALRLFDPDRTDRPIVFGASEAAEAMGLSPYSCGSLELYMRKTGRIPGVEDNDAMEMGRLLEPTVLTLYEKRTGIPLVRDLPTYFHPVHSFMAATPDAEGETSHPMLIAVDAKTSTFRRHDDFAGADGNKFGQAGTDQLPIDYILQAQAQMEVLGLDRADFPVLFDGRTLRIYSVERDSTLIDALVAAEKELAERIINDEAPEPNYRHERTRECLRALHGFEEKLSILLSDGSREKWLEVVKRREEIKELEAENDEVINRILAEMQSSQIAAFPSGEKGLKRIPFKASLWTEKDIREAQEKIGQTKRKGFEQLRECKI